MTVYYQYIPAKPQFLDENGDPYSGGKLYFYEAGTSTPLTVYKTASGTAHSSPIVLDTQGRVPDSDGIFLSSASSYKVVLHDSSDVEIFSVDNLVTYAADGSITFANLQNMSANTVLGSVSGGTPEEITMTAAGRALMDDASAAAQRTTLGFTASIVELNYTTGLTSAAQTQINALSASIAAVNTQLFGKVTSGSVITKGTGFTASAAGSGAIKITFDSAITETYAVVLTPDAAGSTVYTTEETSSYFVAQSRDDESNVPTNKGFSFILTYTPS